MPKWKDNLKTAGQAATYLGMTPRQFEKFRDEIPCIHTPGGHRRFWESELDKWKASTKQPA